MQSLKKDVVIEKRCSHCRKTHSLKKPQSKETYSQKETGSEKRNSQKKDIVVEETQNNILMKVTIFEE